MLVKLAVQKFKAPADRFWKMSVSDLLLSLAPKEETRMATTQAEVAAMCRETDERLRLLAKLTLEQRVELAQLKAELT